MIQRLENDLLGRKSLENEQRRLMMYSVVERRLDRVEVVGSDGHKVTTTTNVEMQLVLKIKEAKSQTQQQ